jgi:NAD(P)-dependent dehydrogenase (short-subunit alcohol dehydrogenase family)
VRLESKVALITGGYGGMGRASARLFAREGATVFVQLVVKMARSVQIPHRR